MVCIRARMAVTSSVALIVTTAATPAAVVFNDTFATSTINQAAYPTVTSSSTAYQVASNKSATATTIAPGTFKLTTAGTSSGYSEAQAIFTESPVTLASAGDYVRLTYTFTGTANIFNGTAGDGLFVAGGLYNSGGVDPVNGLNNSNVVTTLSDKTTGGVKDWKGYVAQLAYSSDNLSDESSVLRTRPAQSSGTNNTVQSVMAQYAGAATFGTQGSLPLGPVTTVGASYTVDLLMTYNGTGLVSSATLYSGVGTGGTVLEAVHGTASGANLLTLTFDGLMLGYRPGTSPGTQTQFDINGITVETNVPVPEPAALSLLAMAGLSLLRRRR